MYPPSPDPNGRWHLEPPRPPLLTPKKKTFCHHFAHFYRIYATQRAVDQANWRIAWNCWVGGWREREMTVLAHRWMDDGEIEKHARHTWFYSMRVCLPLQPSPFTGAFKLFSSFFYSMYSLPCLFLELCSSIIPLQPLTLLTGRRHVGGESLNPSAEHSRCVNLCSVTRMKWVDNRVNHVCRLASALKLAALLATANLWINKNLSIVVTQ